MLSQCHQHGQFTLCRGWISQSSPDQVSSLNTLSCQGVAVWVPALALIKQIWVNLGPWSQVLVVLGYVQRVLCCAGVTRLCRALEGHNSLFLSALNRNRTSRPPVLKCCISGLGSYLDVCGQSSLKYGKAEPGRGFCGAEAGSHTHWTSLGCECCDAIYWNPLSILQFPLLKWCQNLWAKKQHLGGQGRAWGLSGCFGHLQGLSAVLSHSFKGDFSLTWQAHSEIQQCQPGALSGTLHWQPLYLLPPLLLEVKNHVLCLIRPRTHFLRFFFPQQLNCLAAECTIWIHSVVKSEDMSDFLKKLF